MIIAAAIRFPLFDPHRPQVKDWIVHTSPPGRHHNCFQGLYQQFSDRGQADRERSDASYRGEVQGFLTDTGQFLNRTDAMQHVIACGQPMLRKTLIGYQGPELYSEDLW